MFQPLKNLTYSSPDKWPPAPESWALPTLHSKPPPWQVASDRVFLSPGWHLPSCNLLFGPRFALWIYSLQLLPPPFTPDRFLIASLPLPCRLNIHVSVPWPSARVQCSTQSSGHRLQVTSDRYMALKGAVPVSDQDTNAFILSCTGSRGIGITWLIHSKLVAKEKPWIFSQVSYCGWARWAPNLSDCSWNKWFR